MKIRLAYGQEGLAVDLPDSVHLIRPRHVPGLPDEESAIRQALARPIDAPPLREALSPGRVVVVHSDLTRPMPNDRVLPVLLQELEAAGVPREQITFLNGLGTHAPQTAAELAEMLGQELVEQYRCLQHDCWDRAKLSYLGQSSFGHPIWVSKTYLEAEVKILTGFIEPHLFAGYSGGPKAVLPSVAGGDSILHNHGAEMIGHPRATWGVVEGNPIWDEMLEVALETKPTMLLNVTLNSLREITGVFAGDLEAAHAAGRVFCQESALVPVPHLYDIVVTTNSGYPLDLNLYQSVKGMSAAAQIVRPGGAILVAAECRQGIPEHGEYANLLRSAPSPQALLESVSRPGTLCVDQWEAQIQAQVQIRAEVHLYCDGLTHQEIEDAMLVPCDDIEGTLAKLMARYGPEPRVCVLPEGPQTIPYLAR